MGTNLTSPFPRIPSTMPCTALLSSTGNNHSIVTPASSGHLHIIILTLNVDLKHVLQYWTVRFRFIDNNVDIYESNDGSYSVSFFPYFIFADINLHFDENEIIQ